MPRDNNKNNDSRGRRDRKPPGKGRTGAARGPEKKFAKRGFVGKAEGERRPYAGKRDDRPPRRDDRDAPPRRDRPYGDRPSRGGEGEKRSFRPREDRDDKRPYTPREDRGSRPFRPRGERNDYDRGDRAPRRERSERTFDDRKFARGDDDRKPRRDFSDRPRFDRDRSGEGDRGKRPFRPRGERNDFDRGERPPRRERTERSFDDRKVSRDDGDRRPRRDFAGRGDRRPRDFEGHDRGEMKPWQKREARSRDDREPGDRSKFSRPRWETRDNDERRERPRNARPEGRMEWQEHPRSEGRSFRRDDDRPRRDNEDDSRIFAKRPAFGGRGAYRERKADFDKRAPREAPSPKKSGERIAKVLARAGLASRRDAEEMVTQGRVAVNGRIINSPALDITANDVVTVDGAPLPPRERTRLFLYHKPRGLMTTHDDPEGRPTVFDNLPEGLPRLISVGRLDFNTEGLLLLTNDGGLARALELPDTGWLRRYRVRAHGEVTQAQLDALKEGVEVDGVKYGPIEATLERDQGANVWLVFAIREGKNREVRNVMAHLGLEVNRLIRISYGPFQLQELAEGAVEEVKTRVLREQLGEKVAALARADFDLPVETAAAKSNEADKPRGKKPFKPAGKSALIADSKGRRVLVRRTGSAEARARNEEEANGYGPPRRPKRGYHGKRDLKPRDE
ncbi:MAG TPA: pseudouridine synthase [Bradyrhizobium sp.]|uniref:pseudouridine synthase n=1 Tax=Bradyrhizobium sp. TaxID=376 RepID=UPI002D7F5A9E|nr:pseudouridine synthase [Bradyrhizobium sp.]HET7887390.1 pseudouridine synthase [Bradyrhizobium sp.]